MVSVNKFDLIIIGAGSGGVRSARKIALLGKKIAVIEASSVGGTCVNLGCIPKKIMMYSAKMRREIDNSSFLGWDIDNFKFNWSEMVKYRDQEVERIRGLYTKTLNSYENITVINGYAKFVNNSTIEVNGNHLEADKILIATGSRAHIPDIEGKELFINSDQIFYLQELPKKLVILGGGYIAMEFASIMNEFGSDVTVVNRSDRFLKIFDKDSVDIVIEEMKNRGIKFITNNNVSLMKKDDKNQIICKLENGQELISDVVLCAIGRIANVDKLDIENTDIKLGKNSRIVVDNFTLSSVENIYAVGDVTGNIGLVPIAIREAHAFIDNAYNNIKTSTEYKNIPMAVFTCPNIASIGYTEEAAVSVFGKEKIEVVSKLFVPLIEHFRSKSENNFIKFIVEKETNKILGLHMVSDLSPEIIQIATVCVNSGITRDQFSKAIALHPTVSEELVLMLGN